jgi:TonB family protein
MGSQFQIVAILLVSLGVAAQSADSSPSHPSDASAEQAKPTPTPATATLDDPCGFRSKKSDGGLKGRVSGGKLIKKVNPVYPPAAKKAHIEGTVILCAVIAKDGKLRELRPASGPQELIPAAVAAAEQWRYEPYRLNKEPVDVDSTIRLDFKLGP